VVVSYTRAGKPRRHSRLEHRRAALLEQLEGDKIMLRRLLSGLAAAVALLAVSGSLHGHHNTSAKYDVKNPKTVTGTVKSFRMINPHAKLEVEVQENGQTVLWEIESGSPSGLYRRGWRTDDLKAGDRVTATGAPDVNGEKSMELIKLVTPSGKQLSGTEAALQGSGPGQRPIGQ
jgi:hypothetical protein